MKYDKEEKQKRSAASLNGKANGANNIQLLLYTQDLENVKQTLKSDGWEEIDPGYYQSYREILQFKNICIMYKKDHKMSCRWGCMTSGGEGKPAPALEKNRGQITFYGPIDSNLPPKANAPDTELSVSNSVSLGDIPSIAELRDNCTDALVIGYDSEWQEVRGARFILSWQFACFWNDCLHTFLVLTTCVSVDDQWNEKSNLRLRLTHMLAVILHCLGYGKPCDYRNVYCYKCLVKPKVGNVPDVLVFETKNEALKMAEYEYTDSGAVSFVEISDKTPEKRKVRREIRDEVWNANRIPVVLACHSGKADITSLEYDESHNLIRNSAEVQKGLVTLMSVREVCKTVYDLGSYPKAYLVSLQLADTMCHSAASSRSLEALGKVCGVPKIEIANSDKANMLNLLKRDPKLFADYAVQDAVVCLSYLKELYGENKHALPTIQSGGAKVVKSKLKNYYGVSSDKDFNLKYRGIEIVKDGAEIVAREPGRSIFLEKSRSYEINMDAALVHNYACNGYNGGYNYCNIVGYYPFQTYDYDLCSAYPTAMGLIPDIDWVNPIDRDIKSPNGEPFLIDLSYWRCLQNYNVYEPYKLIFADVREFEFPDDVLYPCIGVRCEDGFMVYPRRYRDYIRSLRVAGPDLFLALQLEAKIKVNQLIILRPLIREDGTISRSESYVMRGLLEDRALCKDIFGKGSLPEQVLKTIANSTYGKIAQNVVPKNRYNARHDDYERIGSSAITNPVNACYITSLIRCSLLAAQNQLQSLGYRVFSVTTDGFISDAPEDVVQGLDLYGFQNSFLHSGNELYGVDPDRKIWEIKHKQNDLLNFTTRGNVSLLDSGVCAHAGTKSGFVEDSYEDRAWLYHNVLSREGKIPYMSHEFVEFKYLAQQRVKDFAVYEIPKNVSVDFDSKRRPVRESFETVLVKSPLDDKFYNIVNFDTAPYETFEEFLQYRRAAKVCEVLRTQEHWERFYEALKDILNGDPIKRVRKQKKSLDDVRDPGWAKIWSCAVKHRQGGDVYKIPYVSGLENKRGSVDKIVEFFNAHNDGDHKMTVSNWKDARKPDRLKNVLPDELTKDLLQKLQSYTVNN